MAENVRSLAVAAVIVGVLLLLALYGAYAVWMSKRSEDPDFPPPAPPIPSAPKPSDPPPPPSPPEPVDPGAKILQGAERAFTSGFYETAVKFYLDYDLRYAGGDAYAANAPRVWDRLRAADHAAARKEAGLAATLVERKRLHEEWVRIAAKPPAEAKDELRKLSEALPDRDGRRALIEERLK